jgi:hypothetical protein
MRTHRPQDPPQALLARIERAERRRGRPRLHLPRVVWSRARVRLVPHVAVSKAQALAEIDRLTQPGQHGSQHASASASPSSATAPAAAAAYSPLAPSDPASLSALSLRPAPPHAPTLLAVAHYLSRHFAGIPGGIPLHAPVCTLAAPMDTRTEFSRMRGGVSGCNMLADAMFRWQGGLLDAIRLGHSGAGDANSNADSDLSGNPFATTAPERGRVAGEPEHYSRRRLQLLQATPVAALSLVNGGFLRGDALSPRETELSYAALLEELPFPKTAVFMRILGRDLVDAINQQLVKLPKPSGAFPHLSRNAAMRLSAQPAPGALRFGDWQFDDDGNYTGTGPPEEATGGYGKRAPLRVRSLCVEGVPVEADAAYLLCTTQFIAWGGDGCAAFTRGVFERHYLPERNDKLISQVAYRYLEHLANTAKQLAPAPPAPAQAEDEDPPSVAAPEGELRWRAEDAAWGYYYWPPQDVRVHCVRPRW